MEIGRRGLAWWVMGLGLVGLGGAPGRADAFRPVLEFPVPTGGELPFIALGPDGNLWFTEYNGDRIGRITPAGVITEFSTGISAPSGPFGIAVGPDGNLWFPEQQGDRIGRITPAGVVTEFSANVTPGSRPRRITPGPDGSLWFSENENDAIGRITLEGVVTEFSTGLTPGSGPDGITAGPDGNLWFTERQGNRIGRITPAGVIIEFSAGISPGSGPEGIARGPDGNLWFTEGGGDRIGRITPGGQVTEFPLPPGITEPGQIAVGPDGNLWFTARGYIGVVTTDGTVVAAWVVPGGSRPPGLARGPGGMWITIESPNRIGLIRATGEPADFDGDGRADLVTAQGPGGTTLVRVLRSTDGAELLSFPAYDPALRGASASVAACDLTGDGVPELITGGGPGGGPRIRVFDGLTGAPLPDLRGSFPAFPDSFRLGVLVGCADVNGDGIPDIIAGPGPGGTGLPVRVFSGIDATELISVLPFGTAFRGGVRVGP